MICLQLNHKLIVWKQFYIQGKTNKDQLKALGNYDEFVNRCSDHNNVFHYK